MVSFGLHLKYIYICRIRIRMTSIETIIVCSLVRKEAMLSCHVNVFFVLFVVFL